jgi:nicotinamide-nucleotide amidase
LVSFNVTEKKNTMKAIIINIGDELLIGQTINTNAAWMGQYLNSFGMEVESSHCISDKGPVIFKEIDSALKRAEVVVVTGGLGPTKDDITKHTLCELFQTELVMHEPSYLRVKAFFESRGLPFLKVNEQQALVPASCAVLENMVGTANGMLFERDGHICVSLPGVPFEMQYLMEHEVVPRIQQKFELPKIVHRTILTQGVGESFIADLLTDWENSLAVEDIRLAYLPSPGMVKLRMSIYGGAEESVLKERIQRKEEELHAIIGEYIFGYEKETLQSVLVQKLKAKEKSVSFAESCTGGMMSQKFTDVAGASEVFQSGWVVYHESSKTKELGVDETLISNFGVVSEELAAALAEGARIKSGSDFALSSTGWAGPDGGDEKHGVGTIFVALSSEKGTIVKKLKFGKNRTRNREMATDAAFMLLIKEIQK